MTTQVLGTAFDELTDIQRTAAEWSEGALLVLAGPGSGKTRVLTCRIARLLESSMDQHFRVLALTFTNRAANEMSSRVDTLTPNLHGRANICTFHGFCAQILRQHGVHLAIKPDFSIYSQIEDRRGILKDALVRNGQHESATSVQWLLPTIDLLKAQLVEPKDARERIEATNGDLAMNAEVVAQAYQLYEQELRRINALDFHSLILEANRLFGYPALKRHIQGSYPYWLIDEFQDTNGAQYKLLRTMAADGFRNVFAVADDDQTIFEWNGANARRIRDFVADFDSKTIQFPTNFRCPPSIVEAANRLVLYNSNRIREKLQTSSGRDASQGLYRERIVYREFESEIQEAAGIAGEIKNLDHDARGRTAVLARNTALLESTSGALRQNGIPAAIAKRRDDFLSPQMRWLVACLRQVQRPMDVRNISLLADTFARFAGGAVDPDDLIARADTQGVTYLAAWMHSAGETAAPGISQSLLGLTEQLVSGSKDHRATVNQVLNQFESQDQDAALNDDLKAWRKIEREIRETRGPVPLDQFLQELDMRSKESAVAPGTVYLATIHGAKGREFETVYLMGMAEEILPSWHSIKKGDGSAELEEERRACFVAITRARERLVLSRARSYQGWAKAPSRFLAEMGVDML